MKKKIENPKVFISYAWGSDEYQEQVLAFASQLVEDGIVTVLDKWDLTEGNDTYAFMEKCVNDPTITNVLMLLDPVYAKKADDHTGGVGTETQIISAKVYKKVTQDKFLPIIMKRDAEGNVCKPVYLEGRLHFDLSIPDSYDKEYQKLVKKLYGVEIYAKPKLGNKPNWVDEPISISPKLLSEYDALQSIKTDRDRSYAFNQYLKQIYNDIIVFLNKDPISSISDEEYIKLYDETESIRNNYLQLLQKSNSVEHSYRSVASFLEDLANETNQPNYNNIRGETVIIRIHELFIYTIAHYLTDKDYAAVGYLLGKTYYNKNNYGNNNGADSYNLFYSGYHYHHGNLDKAIKQRDKQNYYTGTGQHWIETLNTEICTKKQFVLADLICFNHSVYGNGYFDSDLWFPIVYVYENMYSCEIDDIARRMISKEYAQSIITIFGYNSLDSFISRFKEIESTPKNNIRAYRYSEAFESPRLLGDAIKSDLIATLR